MKFPFTKTLFLLMCAVSSMASAQSVVVPLDHQVYPLLTKGETLGLFDVYAMRVLPLTRIEVLTLLRQMNERRQSLSLADAALVQQLTSEFTDPEIGVAAQPDGEIHAARIEKSGAQFFIDTRGMQEVHILRGRVGLEDENIFETTLFGMLRGKLSEHFFIGVDARLSLVHGEKNPGSRFDTENGIPQVAVGQNVFRDQTTGYVGYQNGIVQLFAGRMNLGWGTGIDESLGFSPLNEPMDLVQFRLNFEDVRFSYVHANLNGITSDRYIAGHRLDVRLGEGVYLGAYETVVYAGRGVRLAYLNPFVPYHFIEHQEGDLDNNMIGLDISAVVSPGVRLYGELFIDDLNWSKPIFDYWGNKLAYQAGIHWAAPFDFKPLELQASYTRVDPWVYTHYDSLNVYLHYDASIGSRIGPNADRYSLIATFRPQRDWLIQLLYQTVRRGQGSLVVSHTDADGTEKRFLDGTVEQRGRFGASVRYQFSRDIFAGADIALTNGNNAGLSAGRNISEQFFRLYVDINY